jgi:DNA-binding SARP family transcriptional activator
MSRSPGMPIHLRLLGEFRVLDGDRDIPPVAWEHRRSADLVKLLALTPDRRLVKDLVLEALWPQLDAAAATAALHKAASLARKVLGDRIVLKQGEVALAPDEAVTTDVEVFEAAARKAIASGDARECARAATLYGGELLPGDRYADWANPHRERLAARHLDLLRRAGAWEQLVEQDPLDESAQLKVMRLYADAGNRASALRQFRRMRQAFAEQLGVTPSSEAMALYETLSRGPAVHAPTAAPEAYVGREVELLRARTLLRKVVEGKGHTLLVRGDAGMGKTAFAECVLAEAAGAGATTLRGAAHLDGPGAYAPVAEAIDQLLLARPDLAEALTEGARQVLARLATASPFQPGDEDRAIGRQRLLSAVGQLLTVAAKERPVVLFIDDLHDADESTLELVHYLAQLARSHRVLLLAAARPDPRPSFARVRAALIGQRTLSELELGPLARKDVAAIVERIAGARPDAATVDVVHARAAGNPLFAELLASAVAPDRDLPSDLNAVLEGVLMQAGEPAVALLRRLAVLGTQFTTQELLGLAGGTEEACFALLDRALRARLVEEVRGAYRFHHALYVDSLLRGLPSHRRREAHRDAARTLAANGAAASRVALQLLSAELTAEAIPWLLQAAREEVQVAAYASALRFADLALEHGGPDSQLLAFRAQLLFVTGSPETPNAYARAIEAAPEPMRPVLLAHKARAQMSQGDVHGAAATLAGLPPPEDPAARVVYWIVSGQVAWFCGQMEAADQATRAARELAEQTGDEAGLVEAVLARGILEHSRGAYAENLGADLLADRAPALAGVIHEGHLCVSLAYVESGLPFAPIEEFARGLRAAGERMGARRAVAFAELIRGETALLSGVLGEAAEPLRRATELSLEVGARAAAAMALLRRAELAMAEADLPRTHALLDEALELARGTPQGQRHLLQRIYGLRILAEREPARAVTIVDESEVTVVGPSETCMGCSIALLVPSAIACACAGQPERAARRLAMAEQVSAALWPRGPWQAALEEARAAVAAAGGDEPAGRAHLARASALYAEVGQHGQAARCARGLEACFTMARDAPPA